MLRRISFDDLFRPYLGPYSTVPRHTIEVKEGKLVCDIDLPGVSDKELEVTIEDDGLLIKGTRKDAEFSYRLTVPDTYDLETSRARMKDGVLTLFVDPIVKPEPKKVRIETK